ncbi:MAG: hypothetical protein Q8927_17335 [Bacteroidota bacterium]|nr:hypothetical protein [Bacteroidota bacterium]MDP4217970.1 hypothetical protein [Bacteroidota bacterium]MDP4244799.1 hypothetical protein [Bacteroidota bacterium]MDP4259312.1 hypothetical protein [Bacteroidota bacterium]
MRSILLALLLGSVLVTAGQNNFYDAQYLASLTPNQKNDLALFLTDANQMTADQKATYTKRATKLGDLSEEEIATMKACNDFLKADVSGHLFSNELQRDLLNTPLLRKVLAKLAVTVDMAQQGLGFTSDNSLPVATPGGGGLGNALSRLSSTDFQSMLIDATATYLAESFKQDAVYTFFSKAQDELKKYPEFISLFPKSYDKISKLDPFNFNDLGNSWKQAFESDVQVLPASFRDLIKNGPGNTWYGKLNRTPFFTYYSYSVDILQLLVKGYHPLEILETLDKQYTQNVAIQSLDEYQGIIHFVNMLQAGLQDTAKAKGSNGSNAWISFNQLKELNTPKEQLYFFALLYQQDRSFFDEPRQLGNQIKTAILKNEPATLKKALGYFPDLLILLNQVENSVTDINQAKSQKQNSTELISTYIKNVLGILKQTNSLLTKFGVDPQLTGKIAKYLGYGDMGYTLYQDVVAKNYPALIDNSLQLIDSIAGNHNFASLLAGCLPAMMADYNLILAAGGKANVNLEAFTELVTVNWTGQGVLGENLLDAAKAAVGYNSIVDQGTKAACDNAIEKFSILISKSNTIIFHGSDPLALAASLLDAYNLVYVALAKAKIDAPTLIPIIVACINSDGIDKNVLDRQIRALPEYKAMDSASKVAVNIAINGLNGLVDRVNDTLKANSVIFNRVLKVAATIYKYGKIVALVANAQSSEDLKTVIKTYVMPSGSFSIQRSSVNTLTISAMVGAIGAAESDNNNIFSTIRPNVGLTAPIGLEWSFAKGADKATKHVYLDKNGNTHYLTGVSHSLFLQVFDIIAPINYRLTKDSGSLPSKITLAQIFSPGISYNWGLKDLPFDLGAGLQYTPSLRTIGATLQANSLRLFFRISWVKPLIPIHIW